MVSVAGLAFLFLEPPSRTVFWDAAFDLGHACLFGVLTIATLHVVRQACPDRERPGQIGVVAALAVMAGLSELVQLLQPTRDPSFSDMSRDVAGIACGFLVYVNLGRHRVGWAWRSILGWAVALILAMAVGLPFSSVLRAYTARDRVFPRLCVLDGSVWERRFLRVGGGVLVPAGQAIHASRFNDLALLELGPGRKYAGLALDEPFPDWRGYQQLVFTAATDHVDAVDLAIRIRDLESAGEDQDAFTETVHVTMDAQVFAIPLTAVESAPRNRKMNLGRIGGVAIFVAGLTRPLRLYIGDIRLR
jgi:hypothetical protein